MKVKVSETTEDVRLYHLYEFNKHCVDENIKALRRDIHALMDYLGVHMEVTHPLVRVVKKGGPECPKQ